MCVAKRSLRPTTPLDDLRECGESLNETERPLRVLVLNHEFPPVGGGAAAVTEEIVRRYAQRGHSVSVVTMRYGTLPQRESRDGVRIYRVGRVRRRREFCTLFEMLVFVLAAAQFLRKHLRVHAYDINHAHFIVPCGAVALWAKKVFGLRYIVTSHGSDVLQYNRRFRFVYPLVSCVWAAILREATIVTSPSRCLAELIQRLKPNQRVTVVPNGIDLRHFATLPKERRILLVSRLVEGKGIQDVLSALNEMDLAGWQIDIVGDGPFRRTLERRAGASHLGKFVTFHGWVDRHSERLHDLYNKASIFVSASHCENMSVSLLEAHAARCWIVASNVGGTPEIVDSTRLFPAGNVVALREKLLSTMYVAMGRSAPQLSLDRFDWNDIVKQYEALFLRYFSDSHDRYTDLQRATLR